MLIPGLKELEKDGVIDKKNTAKNDRMSIDFIGTPGIKKTPKYYLILGG
jgi:hypothetical protein